MQNRCYVNPLSANPTKCSNALKQFVGNLPTNCLSVFGHFMKLALKGLMVVFSITVATHMRTSYYLKWFGLAFSRFFDIRRNPPVHWLKKSDFSSLEWFCTSLLHCRQLLFTWKTHGDLKFHFGQIDRSEICTEVSFIPTELMWTLIMKLPYT